MVHNMVLKLFYMNFFNTIYFKIIFPLSKSYQLFWILFLISMPHQNKHAFKRKPIQTLYMNLFIIINSLKIPLILLAIRVQLLSVMRGFVNYVIIIHQKWTKFMHVVLVLKENITCILYKFPHFCKDIVYILNY